MVVGLEEGIRDRGLGIRDPVAGRSGGTGLSPQSDEGLVVVLKRPKNTQAKKSLRLFGLCGQASYEVTNLDTSQTQKIAGKAMMESGLDVALSRQPDSALFRYAISKARPR